MARKTNPDPSAQFEKLTPVQEKCENFEKYRPAFDFVFENKDLRNIAISGPYGSGKSSVVGSMTNDPSYVKKHKFLTVAIAHFDPANNWLNPSETPRGNSDDGGPTEYRQSERVLEGQILNQLVHSVDRKRIPKSRFAKTAGRGMPATVFTFLAAFLLLCAATVLLNTSDIRALIDASLPEEFRFLPGLLSTSLIVGALAAGIATLFRRLDIARQLRRVSVKGYDIELFGRDDDSNFDKYMDDILYILERCGADVVVFEDLDRFGNRMIFEKLRELNTLANKNRKKKPLRFFYLVRDDLFDSQSRVKFFDFFIPIVPFVDSSNAPDHLATKLNSLGIPFDELFVDELGLFIDDPRILGNTVNEFKQYAAIQFGAAENMKGKEATKLLAIIAYKNLFPEDFARLQSESGYIYSLINSRDELIAEMSAHYKAQIDKIESEISKERDWVETSTKELELLYLAPQMQRITDAARSVSFRNSIPLDKYPTPESFHDALRQDSGASQQMEALISTLEGNQSYATRRNRMLEGANERLRRLELEAVQARSEIDSLRRLSLSDLLAQEEDIRESFFNWPLEKANADERSYLESVRNNRNFQAIRFLMSRGHIDHSYHDYISTFHEGGISLVDKEFMRAMAEGGGLPADYELDHPETVLHRLHADRLRQAGARNYSLARALLASDDSAKQSAFLGEIERGSDVAFIVGFSQSKHYTPKLFDIAKALWPSMPGTVLSNSNGLEEEPVRRFAWAFLADGNPTEFDRSSFIEAIETDDLFIAANDEWSKKIAPHLVALGVSFRAIDTDEANPYLLKTVYDNNLYQATPENICAMLHTQIGTDAELAVPSKMFSSIATIGDSRLYDYASEHADALMESCLTRDWYEASDDESGALWVLNNEGITTEHKERYIEVLTGSPIDDITEISTFEPFWHDLFACGKATCTASNIAAFFTEAERLDEAVCERINDTGIQDLQLYGQIDGVDRQALARHIAESDLIDDIRVKEFFDETGESIIRLKSPNLKPERVDTLVSSKAISMNEANLAFIRKHYPAKKIPFLASDQEGYVELVTEDSALFDTAEAEEVLTSRNFEEAYELSLLAELGQVELNSLYHEAVLQEIIAEHLMDDDIPELLSYWRSGSKELRETIDAKWVELAGKGFDLSEPLPQTSCLAIMKSNQVAGSQKKECLARFLRGYTRKETAECLEAANLNDMAALVRYQTEKSFIEFHPDDHDLVLVEALQEKSFVGAYSAPQHRLYRTK